MNEAAHSFRLSDADPGTDVVLVKVEAGRHAASRLASMGLLPGVKVSVVRNERRGPFILSLRGGRVVLGRGLADHVRVQQAAANRD